MKKTPRKLVLRNQTLRVLADLDLSRAAGGDGSGDAPCTAIAGTGAAACPTTVAVVATTAC